MSGGFALNTASVLFLVVAALGVCFGFIGLEYANRRERLRTRIATVAGGVRAGGPTGPAPGEAVVGRLQDFGKILLASPLLGRSERAKLADKLLHCGIRDPNALSIFVGCKFLMLGVIPALVWAFLTYVDFWPDEFSMQLPAVIIALMIGWRLPDMWLGRRMSKWRQELTESLPDALDLMVICTDAGLGLEQSIDRVARDLSLARPILAEELKLTLAEMRVLPQMKDALVNLAQRTQSRPIQLLVGTLVQTLQYGTPLGQSLRTLSAEMHVHRFLQFEANAAKLPALLTLPMVIFILPTMFIIVGGPAVLKVLDTIKTM